MQFITNSKTYNHKQAICELLEWAEKCVLCTSFLDRKGVKHLSRSISSGIEKRNLDIVIFSNGEKKYTQNSATQAVASIKGLKHKVTNGKRRLHSKLYYFEKENNFIAIIGSANITHNGLIKNIEFSTKINGVVGSNEHQAIQRNIKELEYEC